MLHILLNTFAHVHHEVSRSLGGLNLKVWSAMERVMRKSHELNFLKHLTSTVLGALIVGLNFKTG